MNLEKAEGNPISVTALWYTGRFQRQPQRADFIGQDLHHIANLTGRDMVLQGAKPGAPLVALMTVNFMPVLHRMAGGL
jgi:hypothetical protein